MSKPELRVYVYPQKPAEAAWPDYVLEALDALGQAAKATTGLEGGGRSYALEEDHPDTLFDLRRAARDGHVNLAVFRERGCYPDELPWYEASFVGRDGLGRVREGSGLTVDFEFRPLFAVEVGKGPEANLARVRELYGVAVALEEVMTARGRFPMEVAR